MKRTVIILLLLLTGTLGQAQSIKLGLQASPQLSWMRSTDDNIMNSQSRISIRYGLEADIFLFGVPRYSLNTGFYVNNLSFKAKYSLNDPLVINGKTLANPVEIKYNINYLEIPFDIKLRSDQFYRMTYYGQFGLTSLINISATATSSDLVLNSSNVSGSIAMFNMGMLMGGGVEYDIGGNTALNFGIQYSNYFLDATTIKNLDEKTTINSIRLVIGVMF